MALSNRMRQRHKYFNTTTMVIRLVPLQLIIHLLYSPSPDFERQHHRYICRHVHAVYHIQCSRRHPSSPVRRPGPDPACTGDGGIKSFKQITTSRNGPAFRFKVTLGTVYRTKTKTLRPSTSSSC